MKKNTCEMLACRKIWRSCCIPTISQLCTYDVPPKTKHIFTQMKFQVFNLNGFSQLLTIIIGEKSARNTKKSTVIHSLSPLEIITTVPAFPQVGLWFSGWRDRSAICQVPSTPCCTPRPAVLRQL